jgi:hypothetical protein
MAEMILEPYAVKQRWSMNKAGNNKWEAIIVEYLEDLAKRCCEAGAYVVGHIKALALFDNGGYLRISVVDPFIPAILDGGVPVDCVELVLTLNVIVYGLKRDLLERITHGSAAALSERFKKELIIEAV